MISVQNIGGTNASANVVVTDPIPAGLTIGTLPANCTLNPAGSQNVQCTVAAASLTAGGAATTITIPVTPTASAPFSVTNTATATGGGDASCNGTGRCTASVSSTVSARPKLRVSKTIAGRLVSTDQFTVQISGGGGSATSANADPSVSTGIFTATAGTNYVLSEVAAGTTNLARYTSSYVCSNAMSGGTTVPASGSGTSVNITPQSRDDITCTFTNTPVYPRLTSAKTVSVNPLVVGATDQFYYVAITVANGPTTAPITIADNLPSGITLAAAPSVSGGAVLSGCASSGSSLGASCQLGANLANGTYTVSIPVNVGAGAVAGGATNTANLGGGGDPSCTAANAGETCDPRTPTVNVVQKSDLSITKVAQPSGTYVPGQSLNYTITVSNAGPSDVTGVSVSDTVPGSVNVANWTCTPSGSASCGATSSGTNNNVALNNVSLPKGTTITITVNGTAQSTATGDIVNTATVTPPAAATCTTAPCQKSATVTNQNVGVPNLKIVKVAGGAFAVGQSGSYAIQVSNSGTTSTSGTMTVTDTLPPGLTITTVNAGAGWNCSTAAGNTQLSCTSSTVLPPGANAPVINLQVSVANGTASPVTNTASVTGGGTACTASAPCTSTIQTPVNSPKMDVTKVLNGSGSFVVGQSTSYTITVTNSGSAATLAGGTITDTIPTGLVIGDLTGSGCSANAQVVTCNVPAGVGGGSFVNFTIPVTPQASANGQSLTNKAQANPDTGDSTCPGGAHCTGTTDNPVTAPLLLLEKTPQPSTFTVNQQASYKLKLSNTGNASTTAVTTVTDVIPGGLSVGSVSPSAACTISTSGSQSTVTCTQAAGLAANASVEFEIFVTPDNSLNGISVTNQATATGGGDTQCVNGTAVGSLPARCAPQTTTAVNAPQLTMSKTANPARFSVGVQSQYILTVTNTGTAPTSGTITITDVVPASLTLGTMPSGCAAQGQQVTCTSAQVLAAPQGANPGASVSFTIPVTPNAAASPAVTNQASAQGGGDPTCPIPGNCKSSITTSVDAPSLQLAKADNGAWVVGQGGAEYTLTVTNASQAVATVGPITVVDTLPAGISAVNGTSGNWSCTVSGQTVTCTSSTSIAANGTDAIVLPVTVDASAITSGTGATVTNNAAVAGGGDPFNGGNPPAPGSACTALDAATPGHCAGKDTVVNAPAALAVNKGAPTIAATGTPGQYTATYTVTVNNTGGVPGSYTLADAPGFPSGVVFNSSSVAAAGGGAVNVALANPLANGSANQISASNVGIANGATHTYTVAITFTTNAGVTALACTGAEGSGAYNAASIGGAPSANCAALPGVPNLGLAKSSNGPWTVAQTGASYTLTVSNSGTASTSGEITVSDAMPTGITAASGTYNGWACTAVGQVLTCKSSTAIAAGVSADIVIPVTIAATAASSVTNKASVGGGGDPHNGGNPPDPQACTDAQHCSGTTTQVSAKADLTITKTSEQGTSYVPGQPLNYTIVVSNAGPSDVTGAAVNDAVPSDVEVSGWSCVASDASASCGGTASGTDNNVNLTGVNLPMGKSVTITVTGKARLSATGDIVNTATVTPPAGVTCTAAPCTKTSTVTSQNSGTPVLSIAKQATPTSFAVGQTGVYSITVTNTGTNSTSGQIMVTDTMPAGITVTSVSGTGWACTIGSGGASISCASSAVLLPGSAAPVINAMVSIANGTATPAVNTAKASGGGTACTALAPCETTIQTNVNRPQLDVTKVLNGSFVVGQQTSYTITATNNGQAETLAGTITDTIPTGLLIGDLTNSGCSASGQVVTCNVPAGKPSGSSVVFTIPVTPQASADGQSLTNKAQANPDTGDSTCPAGTHCTGTTDNPVTAPQLTLTKATSVTAFTVGQQANYQLVLKNTGTADTTAAVTVTDTVPAGLTIDTASLNAACVQNPAGSQMVVCTVASLAQGATVSFDIPVTPQASVDGQTVVNQATATGGGDPLCADGTGAASLPARCAPSTSTVVNAPHLKIVKTTNTPTFSVGVQGEYVLKVTNVGTAPTSGTITVTDVVPASLTLGPLPAGCTAQDQQVTCTSTQVLAAPQGANPGGSVSFTIPVTPQAVVSSPSVSNTATVLGGGDPVCPTNTADCRSTTTTNVDAPSLQLAKADNGAWVVGQGGAEYTLTVTNASATVATVGPITVVDTLPAGISAVNGTSGNWSCTVSGQTVTCTSSTSIAANGTDAIVLPVTVDASAITSGTGATVTNNAAVAGGGDPFNGGNPPAPGSACTALDAATPGHCAGKDTVVNLPAAMVVSKSKPVIVPTATPGQHTATYTVTVVNGGGVPGSYTLNDTPGYPAGVVLDSWTVVSTDGVVNPALAAAPSNGVDNQISATNTTINNAATHTYTVAITFTTNVGVTTMACTGAPGNGAYNAAGIGNGSTDANCEQLPGVPKLSLAKTSNGPWVVAQADARYTLTVSNSGTAATTGTVTVTDSMPAGVTAANGTYSGWSCVASGQVLTCTSTAAIAAGGSTSISVPVTIAAAAVPSVTNSAAVGGGGDPHNGGNPPTPGNCTGDAHCASTSTDVRTQAALSVTKTNGVTKVAATTTTTYTVTITNSGGTDATDLSWTDTVVSGLDKASIEAGTASAGSVAGSCQGLTCTGITVKAGGSVSYTVTAKVTGSVGSKAVNTASVTGGACTLAAPCTSTDSDDIGAPPEVTPVPVDSRTMLMLLGLLLMTVAATRLQRTSGARR
ncbi:beta strand repeat-containing protein [Diaphorobacter ruginosibacter]|uniref:beta strand repeat-containing protein n=1 Tax=Diaphorobacter ruginosibacter TaxID=1715720 RepID=UPI001FEBB07E|nr:DUF11 domain-containing protein [Diaphorobacter ruginosibacter]